MEVGLLQGRLVEEVMRGNPGWVNGAPEGSNSWLGCLEVDVLGG